MISLPDIRQSTDYDCGAAGIDVVCRYYGRRARGPVKLANPIQGMSPDTVEAVFRSLGFTVLAGRMTVDDLAHLTKTGRPVLCCVTIDTGGHWVVVRGVTRSRVHYHCPLRGPRSTFITDWESNWHDRTTSGHVYDRYGLCAAVQ